MFVNRVSELDLLEKYYPSGKAEFFTLYGHRRVGKTELLARFCDFLTDPYLRFFFRFLASRERQLSMDLPEQSLAEVSRHLIDFIGTHTWEELCREWTLRAGAANVLPFMPDDVGSAWNADAQIDVAGINTMEKTLILGECKWTLSPVDRDVLSILVEEKTSRIIPEQGNWRVYYLGFSRSGWTGEALVYQKSIQDLLPSGKNWRVVGIRLLDLKQVDHDLEEWTAYIEPDHDEIKI
ncbi:MAG: hypothetical protein NTZ74_02000 [Chloroflexi bacterium]|nr:hypothetical protein [Chloroflexota bacterium]